MLNSLLVLTVFTEQFKKGKGIMVIISLRMEQDPKRRSKTSAVCFSCKWKQLGCLNLNRLSIFFACGVWFVWTPAINARSKQPELKRVLPRVSALIFEICVSPFVLSCVGWRTSCHSKGFELHSH